MACRPRRLRMEAPATAPMPAAAPARSAGRSGPIPGQVGRRQVDGDAACRKLEAAVDDGGAHPFAAFRTPASGRPTTLKPGSPGPRWVSTRTTWAWAPLSARLASTARDKAASDHGQRQASMPKCRRPPEGGRAGNIPPLQGGPCLNLLAQGRQALFQLLHLRRQLVDAGAGARQQVGLRRIPRA